MQETQVIQDRLNKKPTRGVSWWKKAIAIIAVINLLMALFNFSYVPLRDYYLYQFPQLVQKYDPVKGIEPHPTTEEYLHKVDQLEQTYPGAGTSDPQVEKLLTDLRQESREIIENNPFLAASKFTTFAKIQRVIRQHMGQKRAEDAFMEFWTIPHLESAGWEQELAFFDLYLRPAIASNYFRNVDDFGQYIDEFWRVDIFFILFFAIEYFTNSFVISLRQEETSFLDALLRHWYNIFLLIPFWRWSRIIPVGVRLHTSKLINLERVIAQITHEPAAYLSNQVSQFLLVRLVNQAKDSVSGGDFVKSLVTPEGYIQINNINEVEVIIDRLLSLTIYKVLPKVQPELEALLHHSLRRAFQDSKFYRNLRRLPGVGDLPDELIENLANQLADTSVDILSSSYADNEGRKLFEKLSKDFIHSIRIELQNEATSKELESLIFDLLEEWKINYITKSQSQEYDPTQILEEVDHINYLQNSKVNLQ